MAGQVIGPHNVFPPTDATQWRPYLIHPRTCTRTWRPEPGARWPRPGTWGWMQL